MKIIIVGLTKTDVSTLLEALRFFPEYKTVYHYMEQYEKIGNDWLQICKRGGKVQELCHKFKNVDVVADLPASCFWEDLLEEFPNAKIILTMCESEDEWFRRVLIQQSTFSCFTISLLRILSPSYRKFYFYGETVALTVFGTLNYSPFKPGSCNEILCRMMYRRHNNYVMQKAPKDKLLAYKVQDGWEPLCEFLNVPVPSKPFPLKDPDENVILQFLDSHPLFLSWKREMYSVAVLITGVSLYAGYKIFKHSVFSKMFNYIRTFM